MRPVRCSWVEFNKIRQALSSGGRGEQAHLLKTLGCVSKSTVSEWKAACRLLDAVAEKVRLTELSSLQPTHATEIATALRRQGVKCPSAFAERALEWVERVEDEKLTVARLRELLMEDVRVDAAKPKLDRSGAADPVVKDLPALLASGRRFGTIYADPPWQYGNQATRASTDNHYDTMPLADICALPVRDLAADDAHLHLWTTNGFLREAFDVIEAWGFEYRSCFVWCKREMGIGNYWRVSHEYLMLGVRGGALGFDAKDLMSWRVLDRRGHSNKPPEARAMVERASPGPFLELFGRWRVKGWSVWGNQDLGEEYRQEEFA